MKATIKWVDGVMFLGESGSGHTAVMDGAESQGGRNMGIRPMEMLLLGLGGCASFDVMSMLTKSRQQVTDCTIDIEGQRADAVPAVFTDIHVHYTVTGHDLDPNKVARAVSLSMEKYCSVTRMLSHSVNITHDFSIVAE